tara:strand:+ start:298 stop:477 length:180 start_codon:yes stop_codon:yes gene_type:complete
MTQLKKIIENDSTSWQDFREKNKIRGKGFCKVTFRDGNLIEVDTKIQKVLDWAKTRGLK